MAYQIKNIRCWLSKTVGQAHISLSPPLSLRTMPITHHHMIYHDGCPIAMLKPPSNICNLPNYLHTHLGCALDNNVQKQQGKKTIDLLMNKKSLTIACVRADITTASQRH
jgi:hypothetical protein